MKARIASELLPRTMTKEIPKFLITTITTLNENGEESEQEAIVTNGHVTETIIIREETIKALATTKAIIIMRNQQNRPDNEVVVETIPVTHRGKTDRTTLGVNEEQIEETTTRTMTLSDVELAEVAEEAIAATATLILVGATTNNEWTQGKIAEIEAHLIDR